MKGTVVNGKEYSGFTKIHSVSFSDNQWVLKGERNEGELYLVSAGAELGPYDTVIDVQLTEEIGLWYAAVEKNGDQFIISPHEPKHPVDNCNYLLIEKESNQWTAALFEEDTWNIRSLNKRPLASYKMSAYEPPTKPDTSFQWKKWENQRKTELLDSGINGSIRWTWEWYGERSSRPDFRLHFPDGEQFSNAFNVFSQAYEEMLGSDFMEAKIFIGVNEKFFDENLKRLGADPDVLLPVVFPELIRFSKLRNSVETSVLYMLYTTGGCEYADFSIGSFQMKPSFVEKMVILLILSVIYATHPDVVEETHFPPLFLNFHLVFRGQDSTEL